MALVVDTTIRYQSAPQGENFTFSLSKPLNELSTTDIITAEAFVGFTSFAHNQLCEGNLGTGIPENNPNHCFAWSSTDPFGVFPTSWDGTFWSYPANFPEGVYMRNILVYRPLNTGGGTSLLNTNDAVRIVLEVTPDEDTSMQKLEAVTGNNGPFIQVRYNNDQNAETRLTDYNYISPAVVLIANNVLYLFIQRLGVAYQAFSCWNTMTAQGYRDGYQNFENSGADHQLGLGWTRGLADTPVTSNFVIDSPHPYAGSGHISGVNFNGRTAQLNLNMGSSSGDIWHRSTLTMGLLDVDENKDITKMYMAFSGCRFRVDGTWYKPIVEGGIVVGYTDDMSVQSEWDTWTKASGHNVPVGPPPPDPSDDDSDWDNIPINGGGIGGGSAFCRFYYCTEAELTNLRTWTMGLSSGGDPIPAGFDPKSNIIGLTVFPFTISGSGPTTIKFTTNGGIDPITTQEMPRVVDSGVSCEGGAGNTVRILNTTIDVPATMKDRGEPWLDYESYIELYIPMCGVYQVDPQVCIGRTIHVEIFVDPVSGTVMGIAWVPKDNGKCIIAQGSGTPGVQIPVAVGNYGLSQAARVQNTLGGFGNTATTAISTQMVSNTFQGQPGDRGLNGVRRISQPNDTAGRRIAAFNSSGGGGNIASSVLGFSGLLSSINHWVSSRQIANSPSTSASGGFSGSMAEWCGVFTPYVKIVRPKFRKPNNYKHTCGEPEVTARTLNSTGYAVCINPDISGLTNATEAERAAVYQLLSTGVYYK